jgi:hypothetical protein
MISEFMATSASQKLARDEPEEDPSAKAGARRKILAGFRDRLSPRSTLLLALPLLLYLALPTRNFYWDGVSFAIDSEKGLPAGALLHPSHLIYTLVAAWIYRLSIIVGVHARSLFLLQTTNSLLAGVCVFLFYKCLRARRVPTAIAIPAALIFGFSATWWRFATDANAYIPAIFFLLCAYLLIERGNPVVLAALAHAGAMLFHELALLFLLVALLRLRKNTRSLFLYALVALTPVAVAYLAAYAAVSNNHAVPGLISWATSHTPDSKFYFNPLADAGISLRGTLRLFFGGKLGDFVSGGISKAALSALLIATALFFVRLWQAFRRGLTILRPPRDFVLWAGVYTAFLFIWMPQNTFYRLFYLPALVGIAAAMLASAPTVRSAVWPFVVVLAAWNFCFVIYPQSRPNFNASLNFALAQTRTWTPGAPIVFQQYPPDLWTVSYFSQQASWMRIDRADVADLEQKLEYARSQHSPLWIEEAAYNLIAANPNTLPWLAAHEQPHELLEFQDEKHHFRFHCLR